MSDDSTEYLPEEFRVSAVHHDESAEVAGSLARRVGNASPASTHFGGAQAASFSSALGSAAGERSRAAQRVQDTRGEIATGAVTAANIGDETDADAGYVLGAASLGDVGQGIADRI
ncbi:type VII secretion target [Streptomyces marincola]|uniref:type VII secretion target n=1 Tax=Streptomyces marincola TaxID=2878388 RepID=UPI001CF2FF09|nr:hypothetical protein [Streptomyces marincola]UCM89408.1 hypothetical protein LC193_16435 [Streptomyces marincola]